MKGLLTILTFFSFVNLWGQNVTGIVTFDEHSPRLVNFVWIIAQNLDHAGKDNTVSVRSDTAGHFNLKLKPNELYRISVSGAFEGDTIFNVKLKKDSTVYSNISYPPKTCPYAKSTAKCPVANHEDNVLPIIYGLLYGDEFATKLKNKEIVMGGCIVTDCDPNWYCKKHDIRF
ncbi:MAG: hypothetical protein QM734_07865 [Cyclobacteriaceae bacterium]